MRALAPRVGAPGEKLRLGEGRGEPPCPGALARVQSQVLGQFSLVKAGKRPRGGRVRWKREEVLGSGVSVPHNRSGHHPPLSLREQLCRSPGLAEGELRVPVTPALASQLSQLPPCPVLGQQNRQETSLNTGVCLLSSILLHARPSAGAGGEQGPGPALGKLLLQ